MKPPKANNPVRLAAEEDKLARWIVSTDEFGKQQKCWK